MPTSSDEPGRCGECGVIGVVDFGSAGGTIVAGVGVEDFGVVVGNGRGGASGSSEIMVDDGECPKDDRERELLGSCVVTGGTNGGGT